MPEGKPRAEDVPERAAKCPRCGRTFLYRTIREHKPFPFCSDRCRDVDLGNWMTDQYVVPGAPAEEEEVAAEEEDG